MPKKPETRRPPLTGADGEVRQLTKADIARMRLARDVLPAELLAVLPKRRPGQRGSQKTPTKIQITLRLDARVIDHYRAQGEGWQSRINDDLKKLTNAR
jgi:uncharacterized protein (DUF4415 family)